MVHPFSRSRLFWVGLPGMVFLFWAWKDSSFHSTAVHQYHFGKLSAIVHWQGGITLGQVQFSPPRESALFDLKQNRFGLYPANSPITPASGLSFARYAPPNIEVEREFFPSFQSGSLSTTSDFWSVFVPHGLLILAYSVLWVTAMLVWQRRKSRLLKLHAAPLP